MNMAPIAVLCREIISKHGPPLPIPNREVKPACADGTALLRVGE